jgi:hypothetical protein
VHLQGHPSFLFLSSHRISRRRPHPHSTRQGCFEHAALPFSARMLLLLLSDKTLDEFAAFLPVIVGSRFKKRLANLSCAPTFGRNFFQLNFGVVGRNHD